MGLGFLYAGLYALFGRLCRCGVFRSAPVKAICVYGTPQQRSRRIRRQRKRRKAAAFAGQMLYAVLCCFFTRAWILTESRAAQFRWSMAVGLLLGWAAFYRRMLPVLQRAVRCWRRLTAPVRRLARRWKTAQHTRALAAREKRRVRYERREERLKHCRKERKTGHGVEKCPKNQKDFEKNEQKQWQTAGRVYYNNL